MTGAALDRLLQAHVVRDCVLRAAVAADDLDAAALQGCFWPDATIRCGSGAPWSTAEYVARWQRTAGDFAGTQHFAFNHRLQVGGESVRCETYYVAVFAAAHDVGEETALPFCGAVAAGWIALQGGRWIDRFELRRGEWRIAERGVCADWLAGLDGTPSIPMRAPAAAIHRAAAPIRPSLDDLLAVEAVGYCLEAQHIIAGRLHGGVPPLSLYVTNVRGTVDGTTASAEACFLAVHHGDADHAHSPTVELRGGRCNLNLHRDVDGWTVADSEVHIEWTAHADAGFLAAFVAATQKSIPAHRPSLHDTRSGGVEELCERDAIRDCLARYAQGVDRLDRELVASTFAGPPPSAVDAIFARAAERPVQNHYVSNLRVELRGREALAEARYLTVIGYAPGAGHGLPGGTPSENDVNLVGGRYVIPLVRAAEGRWLMRERGNVGEWHAVANGSGLAGFLRRSGNVGVRGSRGDPSHLQV